MRFLSLNGFCIRPAKQVEFQKWLIDNDARIRGAYPEGMEYGGVYAAVFSSEKKAGEWYWLDILDSYGALDRSAAVSNDRSTELSKINEEFLEFVEPDRHAPWSSMLLKSALDATVYDLPTP